MSRNSHSLPSGIVASAAAPPPVEPPGDPVTGRAVDAPALRARLLEHVYPAFSDHGDDHRAVAPAR